MQRKTPSERLRKRQRRKNIFFSTIIFLGLLSITIFFALKSPFFNIKDININQIENLSGEEIIKQSKIKKNTNIFKLRISKAKKELEINPFIKSLDIKRKLPSTINIDIVEREKAALFKYNSIYLVIDEEGSILEHLDFKDKSLPIIIGFDTKFSEVRENVFPEEENKKLKTFINEAKSLGLLSKIDEIDKKSGNDINIKFKNGIFVAFGRLNNVKYKLSLLDEVLKDIDKKEFEVKEIIMNKGNHPILIIDD